MDRLLFPLGGLMSSAMHSSAREEAEPHELPRVRVIRGGEIGAVHAHARAAVRSIRRWCAGRARALRLRIAPGDAAP